MAFRMNTMFGEVLREVLTDLLITEPNMKRSGIRRRCPGTKRVGFRDEVDLHLGAMRRLSEREREREREREGEKQKT